MYSLKCGLMSHMILSHAMMKPIFEYFFDLKVPFSTFMHGFDIHFQSLITLNHTNASGVICSAHFEIYRPIFQIMILSRAAVLEASNKRIGVYNACVLL